jgi:hypothetical protein
VRTSRISKLKVRPIIFDKSSPLTLGGIPMIAQVAGLAVEVLAAQQNEADH